MNVWLGFRLVTRGSIAYEIGTIIVEISSGGQRTQSCAKSKVGCAFFVRPLCKSSSAPETLSMAESRMQRQILMESSATSVLLNISARDDVLKGLC